MQESEGYRTLSEPVSSLAEQAAHLGNILGQDGPVSEVVMRAAIENQSYAQNLLVCRREPTLLAHLLAHPPQPRRQLSMAELLVNGVKALAGWSLAGFTTVDANVQEQRLKACETCPNLTLPPTERRALYQLIGVEAGERAVCSLCGCSVLRKVRLTSESCPAAHPTEVGMSRWSEPIV
jgi:hypothetical protein